MKKTLFKVALVTSISVYAYGDMGFGYSQNSNNSNTFNKLQEYEAIEASESRQQNAKSANDASISIKSRAGFVKKCVRVKSGGYSCFLVWR